MIILQSVEQSLINLSASSLIQVAGGSIIILGMVMLIGLAIAMHRANIGFGVAVMLTTFILAHLSQTIDTSIYNGQSLGFSFFNLLFLLLVLGVAIIFAFTLFRQR